jgi:hypothetical protein
MEHPQAAVIPWYYKMFAEMDPDVEYYPNKTEVLLEEDAYQGNGESTMLSFV